MEEIISEMTQALADMIQRLIALERAMTRLEQRLKEDAAAK
jgi:hypothetical protein